jgi:lysophospholipase L1-like esterase
MASPFRSTWVLGALLMWAAAGCDSGKTIAGGTGGASSAGGGSGIGGTPGSGGLGGGGSGSGGAAGQGAGDSGTGGTAIDAGTTDAPPTDAGVDAADTDAPRADAGRDAADAAGGFAPCPTTGACIVMPLGDSITEGFPTFMGGYRVELFHQANLAGKTITFVGRRTNGPAGDGGPALVDGKVFPTGNEGYSGFTIDDAPAAGRSGISPLVQGAIAMFHPHVILLMIGTNDINISVDLPNAPARLGLLLDRITTVAPATLLVVAQIVPTTTDTTNARIMTYNAAIPALVQQRASAGKHVVLVDMYTAFTSHADYKTSLMTDELHPNLAGYAVLGQTWYHAIASFLPPSP